MAPHDEAPKGVRKRYAYTGHALQQLQPLKQKWELLRALAGIIRIAPKRVCAASPLVVCHGARHVHSDARTSVKIAVLLLQGAEFVIAYAVVLLVIVACLCVVLGVELEKVLGDQMQELSLTRDLGNIGLMHDAVDGFGTLG